MFTLIIRGVIICHLLDYNSRCTSLNIISIQFDSTVNVIWEIVNNYRVVGPGLSPGEHLRIQGLDYYEDYSWDLLVEKSLI